MKVNGASDVQQVKPTGNSETTQKAKEQNNVPVGEHVETQQEKVEKYVEDFYNDFKDLSGKELKEMRDAYLSDIPDKETRKAVKEELKANDKAYKAGMKKLGKVFKAEAKEIRKANKKEQPREAIALSDSDFIIHDAGDGVAKARPPRLDLKSPTGIRASLHIEYNEYQLKKYSHGHFKPEDTDPSN
jgi:hypothetical protein